MAIKKSELYQSLWTSCDALRATGGMDSSQYKDYVLTMLFIKYISDKYTGKEEIITIPKGSSFEDMVALKGQKDIGDKINKQIIRPIFRENGLEGEVELVDFNDDDKLGSDKEKVDLLDGLIGIFENPALNFKNNRAEDDDILGDAYEFLMRHFATESGKSKGQFYTPAEVSRVLAKIIDMHEANSSQFSVYDPTCGSGSLLLKVAQEAPDNLDEISIAGQEKDNAVKSLAVMNMWMHGYESAIIKKGNSISSPYHKDKEGKLKRFDRVVANPPFSQKSWSQGINPLEDEFNRFLHYGVPPDKNGDYAFLLHIIASLKGNGKAAVILPHGVLFRGNAEAEIRQNLIERKYIKGIVGLPANLFYGTGIPACILVIDKANAETSEGVFMIDASKGFIKDGNKNRLREQDIHKIVDVFNAQKDTDKYARFVYYDEIIGNEYILNIPRYIDTQEEEDIQDLDAHINGGIPDRDIEGMQPYWQVYPNLKSELFEPMRPSYSQLKSQASEIKEAIFNHHEFKAYRNEMDQLFDHWQQNSIPTLKSIHIETAPKKLIHHISEDLLTEYSNKALVDRYDMYQHLMDYWLAVMKDDTYMIIEDGWVAKLYIVKQTKKETVYDCDLVPKYLVVNRYFSGDLAAIQVKEAEKETKENEFATLIEDHSGEESIFEEVENGKVSKAELTYKLKEYEDLAFGTHFPSDFSNYSATVDTLADLESAIKDMIDGDYWGMYFEKLANAKGKLVKGNIQNRILDLKQQISSSDLPDQYQAQAETITKAFEKVDWEYGIKNPWFAELDVLHDYVSKLAKQTALKKSIRQQRESLLAQLAHIMDDATKDYINEIKVIQQLIALNELIASLGSKIKEAYKVLEEKTIKKYRELSEEDVKTLVVGDKWMTTLAKNIQNEIDEISQRLTGRIKELADRYDSTMKELSNGVDDYEMKVRSHLAKMGIDV
jgi:type I restriction enzyme M protein